MLCTVIWDVYRDDERPAVFGQRCRSSFRNTRQTGHVGGYIHTGIREVVSCCMSVWQQTYPRDLRSITGLVSHSGGNKLDAIESWFSGHERLGFTLLLQAAAVEILGRALPIESHSRRGVSRHYSYRRGAANRVAPS